jgi:ectoine hydroxylase-related dioxygenase (phytanoyl-CoA dioxygenase family)
MNTDNLPWVESPFFEDILKSKNLTEPEVDLAKEYRENGYVVIPGLIPQSLIDQTKSDAENKGFNTDFPIKTFRNKERVQDLWQVSDASKELACFPKVLDYLKLLYGRKPVPFQTLNFKYGTQQKAHSDTIHFSSLPARFMCGVWVALEDITAENGPVFYYPGSQNLPEYDFSSIKSNTGTTDYDDYNQYEDFIGKIMKANHIESKQFLAKKGDVLIWSSNIIHGGSPVIKEGSTRWSQVTHYFFEDCYYYTPMLSNMVTKELFLRNNLVNIKTNKPVKQSYNGEQLKVLKTGKDLYVLLPKAIRSLSVALKLIKGKS